MNLAKERHPTHGILHQALVDVRTKQSSLRARLDPLQAVLKGGQIPIPNRFVEEALDRYPARS